MGDAAGAVTVSAAVARPRLVVIGPLPPPWHGGAVATSFVLRAGLEADWGVLHLDTTDRRGLDNIGRLDAGNVGLALQHAARLVGMLLRHWPRVVYVPIAQNTLGVLRDAAFILPSLALRRRVVLHIHGGGFRDFHDSAAAPLRTLVRFMVRHAERVVVLGETLRPMLDGMTDADRVVALPNGTDDLFGTPPDRAARSGPVRVLYLGNLIESKGYRHVMEAVAQLRDRGSAIEVDVAGGFATEAERAAAAAVAERLGSAVRMHGVVAGAAKAALLRDADVFAFPSWYPNEGHPYVVLEAMSAGLPVVATAHAALAETIVPEETGLIVPPRDVDALAAALARLAADAALRHRLGVAARARYEARYSLRAWSAGLAAVLAGAAA